MPRLRVTRRSATHSVAIALAAFYALLATCGEGLHKLTHAVGGCSDASCCVASQCPAEASAAVEGDCPCCVAHAADVEATERPSRFPRAKAPGHDSHDCPVCQLLAQLKQANSSYSPADTAVCLVAVVDERCEENFDSIVLPIERGRGPPSRA